MTIRQRLLKLAYPLIMRSGKNADVAANEAHKAPATSFYSLKAQTTDGKEVSFEQYRGKKVILWRLFAAIQVNMMAWRSYMKRIKTSWLFWVFPQIILAPRNLVRMRR